MIKPIFITSTGTNIGKTHLTKLIINRCKELNLYIDAIKPIISGYDNKNIYNTDTGIILKSLKKNNKDINKISPWRFKAPLSPDIAAKLSNQEIDFNDVKEFCKNRIKTLPNENGIFIIEGVGGTMVPINTKYTIIDLIKKIKIPIILVIGSYLGSISHTLNCLNNLSKYKIFIKSIVISESKENDVGIDITKNSLINHINSVPIYKLKRNCINKNEIIDKIINNL